MTLAFNAYFIFPIEAILESPCPTDGTAICVKRVEGNSSDIQVRLYTVKETLSRVMTFLTTQHSFGELDSFIFR